MTNDDTGTPSQPGADDNGSGSGSGTEPTDARPGGDARLGDPGSADARSEDTGPVNTGRFNTGHADPSPSSTGFQGPGASFEGASFEGAGFGGPSSGPGPGRTGYAGYAGYGFGPGPGPSHTGYAGSGFGPGPGPAGPHQPPPPPPQRPPLRRDRQSRMIAGVCGGLGRHLDIDPVVFRIMFVVLTFFGGLGLLVYAALWLFVPVDGEQESEAQQLLTGGSALAAVAITVVLVLGFMAMVGTISDGFGRAVPLLVVAAAIIAVLVWRNENRRPIGQEHGRPDFAEAESSARGWGAGGDTQPKSWWQRPVSAQPTPGASTGPGPISGAEFSSGLGQPSATYGGTTESRGSADRGTAAADYGTAWSGTAGTGAARPGANAPGTAWPGASGPGTAWPDATGPSAAWPDASGYGTQWSNPGGYGAAPTSGIGTEPAQGELGGQVTRARRLSGVALSGILVAVGILGVLAAGGAIHVGWSVGIALTVMAIGAGMVIGGLYGRTRWLIPVGLVLAVPLIVGNALGVPLRGDTGTVAWSPGSVAAATASTYELAAGTGSLDLLGINPAGGVVHVTAHIGAGRLLVTVPRNVEVQLTAHVGAGEIQFVDGTKENGLDVTRTVDAGPIGTSQGTIALNLRVGTGIVEVDRVNG